MTTYIATTTSVFLIIASIALGQFLKLRLSKLGVLKRAAPERAVYISKVFNLGLAVFAFLCLCFIWGVDYRSLILFSSSVLAIMGVAFVAQWSLLSNITASIIIFFTYPARIGDNIRIVDGDNSIQGKITDITLFQVLIETRSGEIVNYPNNLIVQKPLIKSPEEPQARRLNLPKRNR